MKNIYALFVAIDEYPAPHHRLNGCVNDMEAFKELIEQRFDSEKANLHTQVLRNQEATRENVIAGFREHLAKASSQDLALFYFSGHGSEEPAHELFWPFEDERKNQSIVCWDSRLDGGMDLADKELGYLLSVVSEKAPEILLVMDCCHSGSGSRGAGDYTKKRQMEAQGTVRAIDTYIGHEQYEYREDGTLSALPNGRHVLMAAARSNQTAKETLLNGQPRGVFTYGLIDTLRKARTPLSYQALRERTQTKVFNLVDNQTPQLDLINPEDANKLFLDGTISESTDHHALTWYEDKGSWTIPIGGLQGIPVMEATDQKPTTFYIYAEGTPESELHNPKKALGIAEVTEVEPTVSLLSMPQELEEDHSKGYIAVLKELSKAPLRVWIEGDEQGVEKLEKALIGGGHQKQKAGYIGLAKYQEEANFYVFSDKGEYTITRPHDGRPVVMKAKGFDTGKTANDLEHIARWINVAETSNPNSNFGNFPFKVEVIEVFPQSKEQKAVDPEKLLLPAKYVHGAWQPRQFTVRITNEWEEPLHLGILYLSSRYGIQHLPVVMSVSEDVHGKETRRPDFTKKLLPGESLYAISGMPLTAQLGQDYQEAGITMTTDILKVFASTDEFDLTKFKRQGNLKLPVPNARVSVSFFDDDLGGMLGGDWNTQDLRIQTIQPLTPQPFSWNQGYEGFGFRLKPHNLISGRAMLSTAEACALGLGTSVYPPTLPGGIQFEAVKLTEGWKDDQGLAVLELLEVDNPQEVTEEAPLLVSLGENAGKVDKVLAIGKAESHTRVIGKAKGSQLAITKLPDPTPTLHENLLDSRKIAFIRVVGDLEQAMEALGG